MGLSTAPLCCQRMTEAVIFIYTEIGYRAVVYLDDMAGAEIWEKKLLKS